MALAKGCSNTLPCWSGSSFSVKGGSAIHADWVAMFFSL